MAGSFNFPSQKPLFPCSYTRSLPRNNFSPFRYVSLEQLEVFIVDILDIVDTISYSRSSFNEFHLCLQNNRACILQFYASFSEYRFQSFFINSSDGSRGETKSNPAFLIGKPEPFFLQIRKLSPFRFIMSV